MKGAKIAGKALKNNRKVIGAGVKLANVVLRETTGVTIPGAGLIAGGSDDDSDGVLGVIGAVGGMVGGGGGDDGDVEIDMDETCEVDVEVDEVSIYENGNVDVMTEEVDIYENQESVEYVDYQSEMTQPVVIPHAQPAAKRPQHKRKQVTNNPQQQRPAANAQQPNTPGPVKGRKPQQSNPNANGRNPLQQRPSATPIQTSKP